jgi:RNA polymerase sigma-70 factor, ECF subfamily
MEQNRIDVHQQVVQPFPAKELPSSRRRPLGHRYSATVAQEGDKLQKLPKDRGRDPFADRAERHPLEKTRATGDSTPRRRIRGGSPREADRSLRQLHDAAVPEESVVSSAAPSANDEVLVEAAKSGNHSAFVELWKRHSNTAFKMAYRITGNRDDAEDVIQDAWMKAYVHLKTFDGRAKFSTWLTRIAINSALMTLRKRRSHPEASMEINDGETWQHREIADQTKDVEELYARHETVERLRRAICRLQPALRDVVEIHQSNDGSVKELAELAGISVAATKSRLLRARNILRRALD